jgi:hypothetical protein
MLQAAERRKAAARGGTLCKQEEPHPGNLTCRSYKGGRTLKIQPALVEEGPHTYIHTKQRLRLHQERFRLHQKSCGYINRKCGYIKGLWLHRQEATSTSKEAAATSRVITKKPQLQITHSQYKEATASKRSKLALEQ